MRQMTDQDCALPPLDYRETIDVETAAKLAGVPTRTIRRWCQEHGIGRRIGGGPWRVIRPALAMLCNGDHEALRAWREGDREGKAVASYYWQYGLAPVLAAPKIFRPLGRLSDISANSVTAT
jgi:hypothetical protein